MKKAKALRSFYSTKFGDITEEQTLDNVPDSLAELWASRGMIEILHDAPALQEKAPDFPTEAGEDKDASLSPAAPVSRKRTRRKSKAKES